VPMDGFPRAMPSRRVLEGVERAKRLRALARQAEGWLAAVSVAGAAIHAAAHRRRSIHAVEPRCVADFVASSMEDAQAGRRRSTARSRPPRAKKSDSPYFALEPAQWLDRTRELLGDHPLDARVAVEVVNEAWDSIFDSTLGPGVRIGIHIFPKPQILAFLLHELIAYTLAGRDAQWRAEHTAADKDIVYIPDDEKSIEIKASSHISQIYGNRSYGQEDEGRGKKAKSGYYLAINFEGWPTIRERPAPSLVKPAIRRIRFGWLDHTDWLAQASATGQQSSIPALVENSQLLTLARYD
jgi:hypothetical protein